MHASDEESSAVKIQLTSEDCSSYDCNLDQWVPDGCSRNKKMKKVP